MIRRSNVESEVSNALRESGISVLIGASGLGKSIVARAVAGRNPRGFAIVDFRNADSEESRHRLDMLFARVGGLRSSVLIFDDMDCIDSQHVALPLSRVIDASRRHSCEVIFTCHRNPAWSVLAQAGFDQRCSVDCPYFTEEEVCTLVASNGGDPGTWGRVAFLLGSGGHPQLTHAFVIGMKARGWPVEEIEGIIKKGLRSKDVAAAREAARRYLVSALPEGRDSFSIALASRAALSADHWRWRLAMRLLHCPKLESAWINSLDRGLRLSAKTDSAYLLWRVASGAICCPLVTKRSFMRRSPSRWPRTARLTQAMRTR